MTTKSEEFHTHILSLFQNAGFQTEAAQIQAKALLSEVAEQVPSYKWSYTAQRVIRNLVRVTFELQNLSIENVEQINDLSNAARQFALIWESLAQLQEATTRNTALLNAAVNYELAGYQANALCIAKQISYDQSAIQKPSMLEMSSLFIQRRFLQLMEVSKKAQVEPSSNGELDLSLIEAMGVALAGNAFFHAVKFFLAGDRQSFKEATEVFKEAEDIFASLNLVEESNLVRKIRSLLPVMEKRSTWTLLLNLSPGQSKWQRYLKLLARGVGVDIYKGRSVSELWPSQITALNRGLLNSNSNKIVKMPTSAGKTRIAELAIVHTLINNPDAKCIYIAPYRALVSELEQSFLNLLSDLGYRISSITGNYESDDFEELLLREADILVTTPEKLDLLLRAKPEFLDRVCLFVLDEAHIVNDRQRGVKFELLFTRLKRKLPNARIIAISAVVPQETLEDFANWFNASPNNDLLTSSWRPSIQRYAKFEWRGETGVIRYAPDRDTQLLAEFVPGVIREQIFEYINPETGRRKRQKFPEQNNKSQIAAELAYKFAELGSVLVFCTQPSYVEAIAKALKKRVDLSSLTGQNIPSYFIDIKNRSYSLAKEWLGDSFLVSCFQSGIGVHYGGLPDVIRNAVETDFRQRKLRVIIATNTLAQGVNLPVKTVIIHSCKRYDPINQIHERISARDYWNIAGRAGRAGEETEGLVIHIQTGEQDEKDFRYYLSLRDNVEAVEGALYQRLVDLLQNRLSEEALKVELNPEVLALLVEESPSLVSDNVLQEILEGSLVQVQAARNNRPLKELKRVFTNVANDVLEQVPDAEYRAVYSSTGLSTDSCKQLQAHVTTNESYLQDLLVRGGLEYLDQIIDLLLPVCLSLAEMQLKQDFSGSYSDLLKKWIRGTEINDLVSEFASQSSSVEDFGKLIDDLFRYRLPWGISAYLRIATKVLNIGRIRLSDSIKFLPSIVKFGLPDPSACWAMAAGVPFRKIAILLAASYRNESEIQSYEDFLRWLNTLSNERLSNDFRLTSPMLEDVSRAIFISSVNPLLRQFTNLEEFLPYEVEVQGIKYENRLVVALRAQPGQRVELIRDYDNLVDRNAIAVYLSNEQMGYVPYEVAQILAPEMDTGNHFEATVIGVERERVPKVSVRIVQS